MTGGAVLFAEAGAGLVLGGAGGAGLFTVLGGPGGGGGLLLFLGGGGGRRAEVGGAGGGGRRPLGGGGWDMVVTVDIVCSELTSGADAVSRPAPEHTIKCTVVVDVR